jgi:hypothetical protein
MGLLQSDRAGAPLRNSQHSAPVTAKNSQLAGSSFAVAGDKGEDFCGTGPIG